MSNFKRLNKILSLYIILRNAKLYFDENKMNYVNEGNNISSQIR